MNSENGHWFKFNSDENLCDQQPTDYGPYLEEFKADVSFEE